ATGKGGAAASGAGGTGRRQGMARRGGDLHRVGGPAVDGHRSAPTAAGGGRDGAPGPHRNTALDRAAVRRGWKCLTAFGGGGAMNRFPVAGMAALVLLLAACGKPAPGHHEAAGAEADVHEAAALSTVIAPGV